VLTNIIKIYMDKKFFTELCKDEAILVEKLRVLREFKAKFFGEELPQDEVVNQSAYNTRTAIYPSTTVRRTNKKGKRVTVGDKVINALSALGTGGSRDVANKLIELYASDYKNKSAKAIGDARYQISDLVAAGTIEVHAQGIGKSGNIYKLKTKEGANLPPQ
jgi:hypothetical protein